MDTPYIGSIFAFAGTYAPKGWQFCAGQILAINTNQALFAILGTTYGGDGRTTFALPDLRGRVPVGYGTGPGLSPVPLGEMAGTTAVTLTQANLPMHIHQAAVNAVNLNFGVSVPDADSTLAVSTNVDTEVSVSSYGAPTSSDVQLSTSSITVSATGGSQPLSIMQPSLALNFIIAVTGIFPSRN